VIAAIVLYVSTWASTTATIEELDRSDNVSEGWVEEAVEYRVETDVNVR